MLYALIGIIVGILLTVVFYMAGTRKEDIVKRLKSGIIKDKGYIVGLSESEQQFQDSLKSIEEKTL